MTIPSPDSEPPLQPLRIPAGWLISYNDFRAIDPSEDAARRLFLRQDLFQATCRATNILVGWYPDSDPTGFFRIVVYEGDFTGTQLACERSNTRDGAVEILDRALLKYHFKPEKGWT